MTNNQPKKAVKKSAKKTPAAKKAAAKKTAAKKAAPAKKAPAKNAAPKKIVGPYANMDPAPKQHKPEVEAVVEVVAEPKPEVMILEKPSWRARLVGIFSK
jgi:hypothetical protein